MDEATQERRTIGDVCATVLLQTGIELANIFDNYDMMVMGVAVDYNTPAIWLCMHMTAADNWLYVVLTKKVT